MAFLKEAELKTKSLSSIINLITVDDDTTVDIIIKENIDVMRSYLHQYYDTEAVFNAIDDERSFVLLKHLKSLVIAEIHGIRKEVLSDVVQNKYDEAMTWLEKVASGDITPDLPAKQVDEDGDGVFDDETFMKLGGRKNYANRP